MRNLKAVALASVLLVASSALAAGSASSESSDSHFYLGIGGGIDVPTQNANPAFNLAGAGEVQFGYAFAPEVAVQVQIDNQLESATILGTSDTLYTLRPVAEVKLSAPIDRFSPYILAGAGINVAINSYSGQSNSTTSFDALGGLGAQYDLGGAAIYVEGKYNFAFVNNVPGVSTVQDIPVEAGVNFNL